MYLDSHARCRKSRKLEKPFLDLNVLNFYFRRLIKSLKTYQHIILKKCVDFFLLVELYALEYYPGPLLRSAEAGERLGTRQ